MNKYYIKEIRKILTQFNNWEITKIQMENKLNKIKEKYLNS